MPKPWASIIESQKEMSLKLNFVGNLVDLSKKLSNHRIYALKHYLNYTVKQHELNLLINAKQETEEANRSSLLKVKFKTGGGPGKLNQNFPLIYNSKQK